jgi:hypothetical protein
VIHLQSDKSSSLLEFAIVPVPGLDSEKFTLKGDGGNLIPGNTKSLYGYIDDFISCLDELDEAPTNIQISADTDTDGFVTLANNEDAGFLIGTLSATDPDTDTTTNALTFTTT